MSSRAVAPRRNLGNIGALAVGFIGELGSAPRNSSRSTTVSPTISKSTSLHKASWGTRAPHEKLGGV
jgi:hypothetical protein